MPKKTKTIINYLLLFIESILFFIITILLILKCTVLNDSYIRHKLAKNQYYEELYNEVLLEMSYYTNQSGFEDDILKDIFTLGEIKLETNKFIDSIYKGKSSTINIKKLNERLENNINNYIENTSFEYVNKDEISDFIKAIDEVYENEIKLMGYADKIAPLFYKIIRLCTNILIISSLLFILLVVLNHILLKSKQLAVIPIFSSFSLTFFLLYIKNNIDFNNIFIYSSLLSKSIKSVINNIRTITIIVLVVYILIVFLYYAFKKKKKSY